MHKGCIFIACGVLLLTGCKKQNAKATESREATDATRAQKQPGPASFDACPLITREEIQTIEGSRVKDSKSSGRSDAGLSFAQCFYTTEEFNKSVSLAVTKPDANAQSKRSIKEYWHEMFGKYETRRDGDREREREAEQREGDKEKSESLKEQRREREEEGESVPPRKIAEVGDEAYWLANRVGGALYVLHKNAVVRISVGGADAEDKKIEKSKQLAQKALGRL